ncbi:MAG: sugar-binding transcriptional regulator [Dorea sp.]|nr:sugar-binding transcriptional regulator [Dorea sp.]
MRTYIDDEMTKKIALIAEMYYLHGMSQDDISKRMKMSRPWVSKLLKRAEEMGIVRIEVNSPLSGCADIEQKLKERFRIDQVCVVRPTSMGSMADVGHAAANYLVSAIQEQDKIGVSWGLSVATMVDYVTPIQMEGVTVVPLVGGAGSKLECQSNVIADKLAAALSAKCELLHANAYCADEREYKAIMSNPKVRDVIRFGEQVDLAIVGVGGMEPNRMIEDGYVGTDDVKELNRMGAVGDVALRFIDKGGEVLDADVNYRLIAGDLNTIREHVREVIAVGFGETKAEVLKAAMKSGLITTLFTDLETAEILIGKKKGNS